MAAVSAPLPRSEHPARALADLEAGSHGGVTVHLLLLKVHDLLVECEGRHFVRVRVCVDARYLFKYGRNNFKFFYLLFHIKKVVPQHPFLFFFLEVDLLNLNGVLAIVNKTNLPRASERLDGPTIVIARLIATIFKGS